MLIFGTPLFIGLASAGNEPYVLPITRNEITHKMVAAPFWLTGAGGSIYPVIEVKNKKLKTITIQGHSSLRKLTSPKKSCTIKTGLYHPWAEGHSVNTFYSVLPWTQYEILKDVPEEGLKKGDILDNVISSISGVSYVHVSGKKRIPKSAGFGDFDLDNVYKQIDHQYHEEEKWLYLTCKEGYNVFISDNDLSMQTGNIFGKCCESSVAGSTEECVFSH